MRLRNITQAGVILLVLAFTVGMAGANENGTGNETHTVNATGNSTVTYTVTGNSTETYTATGNSTETYTATGNSTETYTATGNSTETFTPTSTASSTSTAGWADGEESDRGIFGPGHLLYRLQLAFEQWNEDFTFNTSEKLGKQVSYARHRINEYRAALKKGDLEAADIALAQYVAKTNDMDKSMSKLSDKDTGFINAQQMILKHQLILENLSISYPNSTGLQKAYSNSKNLQTKFASKAGKKSEINSAIEDQAKPKAEKKGVPVKDERPEKGTKNRK